MLFRLVIIFSLFFLNGPALAEGEFKFSRDKSIDPEYPILNFVERESKVLVKRMNQIIRVPEDVSFIFGADDGPLYDSETHEILMPDDFTLDVMERFVNANYVEEENELFEVTMDVIEHTLYHELGHALVELLQIPVTGKEEDAVDSLATMLVIISHDHGGEVALSAADLFDLEGEDINEFTDEDFWGEHSLDFQRFYNTICFIYGSEPEKYQYLIKELDIAEDRAELCIADYHRQYQSWAKLLRPYLKDKNLLN